MAGRKGLRHRGGRDSHPIENGVIGYCGDRVDVWQETTK